MDEGILARWAREPRQAFMDAGWGRWLPFEACEIVRALSSSRSEDLCEEEALEAEERPVVAERTLRMCAKWGVSLCTVGDLIQLMEHAGILKRIPSGGVGSGVQLCTPMPLPECTGVLSPSEVAEEDSLRWKFLAQESAQALLDILECREESTVLLSVGELAQRSGLPVEEVRAASSVLEWHGWDVPDVERAAEEESLVWVWCPTDSLFETILGWEAVPGGAVPVSLVSLAHSMGLGVDEVRRGLVRMQERGELRVEGEVGDALEDDPLFVYLSQ